jgi:hypothetical protein
MAATGTTAFDEPVRPEDVRVEEALDGERDEGVPEDPAIPDEANEADVLEQRVEVPSDDDDEPRGS